MHVQLCFASDLQALYVELSSDLRPRLLSALDTGDMVGVVKVQAKLLQLRSQYLVRVYTHIYTH